MPPTVVPFNYRRWIAVTLGASLFVVGGAWLLVTPGSLKNHAAGVAMILFFGFALVVAAGRLIARSPELVISDDGFVLYQMPPVAWSEVVSVGVVAVSASHGVTKHMVGIELNDPAAYAARAKGAFRLASGVNKAFGFFPVNIPPLGRQHSLEWIIEAMRVHHPALVVRDPVRQ